MDHMLSRQEPLLGAGSSEKLSRSRAAVFGLGGVGGHCAEALVRCGLGSIALIDGDRFNITNLNRQLFSSSENLGLLKVREAARRLKSISPALEIQEYPFFYTPDSAGAIDLSRFDCVLDAMDMVSAKLELILRAQALGVPVISCMGAGNKLDPTAFRAGDIYSTSVCPLARVMRRELRRRGVKQLRVVYSLEPPRAGTSEGSPASVAFVPAAAGLVMASEAVHILLREENINDDAV